MWARASSLDRHMQCPAASYLPRDEDGAWVPGYLQDINKFTAPNIECIEDNIWAEWGTEMHLAKENHKLASPLFLAKVDSHRERLWPSKLGRHEIPVAYNCRTGNVFEGPAHDNSWKRLRGPDDITGTADWIGRLPNGEIWVDDLKTGHNTPAPDTVQLLFYGLCFYKLSELPKLPTKTIRLSATHWRRDWDEPRRFWTQIQWKQLSEFEEQLRVAWLEVRSSSEAKSGLHCSYCPSVNICPAVNGIPDLTSEIKVEQL